MTKILFLDMDGVLNDAAFFEWVKVSNKKWLQMNDLNRRLATHINPINAMNLLYVLKEDKDVRVVISSTWRKHFNLKELQYMLGKLGIPKEKIIGKTGIPPPGKYEGTGPEDIQRGDLCLKWANENLIDRENFVCVDDDNDFDSVRDRFVRTNYKNGFIRTKAEEVLKLFGSYSEPANDFARDVYTLEPKE